MIFIYILQIGLKWNWTLTPKIKYWLSNTSDTNHNTNDIYKWNSCSVCLTLNNNNYNLKTNGNCNLNTNTNWTFNFNVIKSFTKKRKNTITANSEEALSNMYFDYFSYCYFSEWKVVWFDFPNFKQTFECIPGSTHVATWLTAN